MTTPEQDHSLNQDQSRLVRQLSVALWTTVGIAIVLVLSLIGVVIWLAVVNANEISNTNHQIAVNQTASDRRWCATFDLLTTPAIPAPTNPAANPSREATYQLYSDFVALEKQFGCRP